MNLDWSAGADRHGLWCEAEPSRDESIDIRGDGEAEAAGRAAAEGLTIASELAAEVRTYVQGIQTSTAAGAVESALGVMKAIAA